MASQLVTPSVGTPLGAPDVADHLRLTDYDQFYLDGLIEAATGYVEGFLEKALLPQTWELTLPEFPDGFINVPVLPLRSVESIKYIDPDGVEQTLDPTRYETDTGSGRIIPIYGKRWPSTRNQLNAVTARYEAGFDEVPEQIKTAILLVVGFLYENREGQGDALDQDATIYNLLYRWKSL